MEGVLTATEQSEGSQGVLGDLFKDHIAPILFWRLPLREVAKLACVCRSFRAASNFDSVWESMLPPTYKIVLPLHPDLVLAHFPSKRELFEHLCRPVFRANNTQGLWIDRNTRGLCWSMAARGLRITWGNDDRYWDWAPDQNSLFPEIAQLKMVCWFEVKGELECTLPPGAYTFTWRMCLGELEGWNSKPAHFTLSKNDDENIECKCYIDPRPHVSRLRVEQFSLPTTRVMGQTGWTEYDVGEFRVEEGEQTCLLRFAVVIIHSGVWKRGLSLDGVVVRPTEVVRAESAQD